MKPVVAEICVIGDGPAGASVAGRLAQLGHVVVLIGDGSPRRRPLPESLSPGGYPFLDSLGVSDSLKDFITECVPSDIRWETASAEPTSAPASSLVDRSKLDACLLRAATRMGVQVITGKAAVPGRQDGRWAISFPALAGKAVRANFLIVATGRTPLLLRKRARILLPLLALYAHWKPSPSIQPQIAIEALRDGWVWRAPLADGNCCAVAFADPVLRSQSKHRDIQSDYLNLVSQAGILADCLNGCRLSKVSACDASAVAAEDVIGRDWMLVGDSAVALEPISAQGIQVALKMGFQGAIVAHTLISNAGSAPLAETFYRDQCRAIATRHAHAAGEFYARPLRFQDEPFWKSRASLNNKFALEPARRAPVEMATKLRLSANVRLHNVPCLIGERIRMHPALNHTGLDGPVSHLGEIAVAALLNPITEAKTVGEICRLWTQMELTQRPLPLVHWFLKNGVLMPIDATK